MRIVTAPPVYDPGGPVAFINALADEPSLPESIEAARAQSVVLCIVRCPVGSPDEAHLREAGFTTASEWYRATPPLLPPDRMCRFLREDDIPAVARMAEERRQQHAAYQPVFWRVHPEAVARHTPFLAQMLSRPDVIALGIDGEDGQLAGFVLADRGGIDDFCVRSPERWADVGASLLRAAADVLVARGVGPFTVVCGHQDQPKRTMLQANGLVCAECWWTLPL